MTIKDIKEEGLLLFECISGSKAYGLNTPRSDTDLKGVYYLPKAQFYGLEHVSQISNESNDEVYYELGRFVELLIKNNPNILELLASPDDCVLYKHPIMSRLHISMFMSKLCKETFAGYALTQIKKARGYKKKIINPVVLNVKRPNRDELLSIKAGNFQYDDLLAMAHSLMDRIETAYENSPLPAMPHKENIEEILVQMREELYG